MNKKGIGIGIVVVLVLSVFGIVGYSKDEGKIGDTPIEKLESEFKNNERVIEYKRDPKTRDYVDVSKWYLQDKKLINRYKEVVYKYNFAYILPYIRKYDRENIPVNHFMDIYFMSDRDRTNFIKGRNITIEVKDKQGNIVPFYVDYSFDNYVRMKFKENLKFNETYEVVVRYFNHQLKYDIKTEKFHDGLVEKIEKVKGKENFYRISFYQNFKEEKKSDFVRINGNILGDIYVKGNSAWIFIKNDKDVDVKEIEFDKSILKTENGELNGKMKIQFSDKLKDIDF